METECRRFEGKVALVTGAARGIGLGVATAFSKEGAIVAVNDISERNLQTAIAEVRRVLPRSNSYRANVADSKEIGMMVDQILEDFQRIDILINNAGIALPTSFLEISEREWDEVMSVNLKSAFLVSKSVIPHMLKRREGKIVMMASLSGRRVASRRGCTIVSRRGG